MYVINEYNNVETSEDTYNPLLIVYLIMNCLEEVKEYHISIRYINT